MPHRKHSRVLVIDDDPEFREPIATALTRAGYEVTAVRDGWRGVEAQRQRASDLVITDLFMPEKDGFETLSQLKSEFPDTPVIVMSGKAPWGPPGERIDYLKAAGRLGAIRMLRKPFGVDELLSAVRDVMDPLRAGASGSRV